MDVTASSSSLCFLDSVKMDMKPQGEDQLSVEYLDDDQQFFKEF